MSRIGKKPIQIPAGVEVKLSGDVVSVKGPLGSLSRAVEGVIVEVNSGVVKVTADDGHANGRAMWGLMRTLIDNMVTGVSTGFSKTLTISGTGYKAEAAGDGKALTLYLGYSKPVEYPLPADVTGAVEDRNLRIVLRSINKESLGDTAAKIRALRPVEPYKGKGVAYLGEKVRRKAGKAGIK